MLSPCDRLDCSRVYDIHGNTTLLLLHSTYTSYCLLAATYHHGVTELARLFLPPRLQLR